jgi:hypothetical protein
VLSGGDHHDLIDCGCLSDSLYRREFRSCERIMLFSTLSKASKDRAPPPSKVKASTLQSKSLEIGSLNASLFVRLAAKLVISINDQLIPYQLPPENFSS